MVTSPKQYLESPHRQEQQGKREERKIRSGREWEGHSSGDTWPVLLNPEYFCVVCLL